MPRPQLLTDRRKVEIVRERGHRSTYRTTDRQRALHSGADRLFKRIALDVLHRLLRVTFEVVALIDAVECGLDDARILASLDLFFQICGLGLPEAVRPGSSL